MTTSRLNPIEGLLASLTGMAPGDAEACGNWARLNAAPDRRPAAPRMTITVDPMLLASSAAAKRPETSAPTADLPNRTTRPAGRREGSHAA